MDSLRTTAIVREIKGTCPIYELGDKLVFKNFYLKSKESKDVCIHAFVAMSTLISAFFTLHIY